MKNHCISLEFYRTNFKIKKTLNQLIEYDFFHTKFWKDKLNLFQTSPGVTRH